MHISNKRTEIYVNGSALLGVYPQMSPPLFVECPHYVIVFGEAQIKKAAIAGDFLFS